ncbi:hypothetical protein [Streptomyces sp. NPDC048106]|uniref:hypothetical protein n=1 Tax=Streptomyces sp. NPDC048106 TaxID=3155750 RepID=UPI003455542B
MTVLHQAASIAIVPEVVDRAHMHAANARIAGARRTAAAVAAGTTQRSLRQQLCPSELQSRAQQTSVWLVTGLRPAAALTAGAIAADSSVHAALNGGTLRYLVPAALLWASPVRHLTTMPTSAKDSAHAS